MSSWRLAGAGITAVLSMSRAALAEPREAEPIALRYEATGPCPSEAAFVAAVRKYSTRWSRVPEGTPNARSIRVSIAAKNASVTGRLIVANAAGTLSERELEGPSCSRVASGMAVMVALAIDAAPADEPATTSEETTAPPNVAGVEQRSEASRRPESPPQRARATTATKPVAGRGLVVSVDLRAETSSAIVRGAVPGLGASVKLEPPSGGSWLGTWKPSVALGVRQSFPKERAMRGGSAEFLWSTVELRLCPLRVAFGLGVEVSPCAELDIGVLQASATGFSDTRHLSSFWLDLGASLWATVPLSERFFLSSTLLLAVPMNRQPFVLSSGTPITGVPPLGVLGGLGAGVRL